MFNPNDIVTRFIQELSTALDEGKQCTLEEVHEHIRNKTLITWLKETLPYDQTEADLIFLREEETKYLQDKLYELLVDRRGNEIRKWGIDNNGYCLLISWSAQILTDIFKEYVSNALLKNVTDMRKYRKAKRSRITP